MAEIKISVKNNTPNINVSSGGKKIIVDSELSLTSENPVQNKAVTAALADKVDKVEGKGLSTEDYTSEEKSKLSGLPPKSVLDEIYQSRDYFVDIINPTGITDGFYPSVNAVKNYAEPKTTVVETYISTDSATGKGQTVVHMLKYDNRDTRFVGNDATEVIFSVPNGEYATDYISAVSFKSGATPTHISYAATGIIQWIGTDCFISDDNKSIFKPSANTHYDIVFYYNGGNYIVGLVNGYKVATAN